MEGWEEFDGWAYWAWTHESRLVSGILLCIGVVVVERCRCSSPLSSIKSCNVFIIQFAHPSIHLLSLSLNPPLRYHVSEDFFDNTLSLHAWWDFIPKVIVDQTFFGPIWNNSYILLLGLMQLQSPSQIFSDMKRTTIPLIVSGLKLWPFVHCITYGLIPVENRLLWVDAVEIVWVTILAGEAASSGENGKDASDIGDGEEALTLEKKKEAAVGEDGSLTNDRESVIR
jgi:hypothetical protein